MRFIFYFTTIGVGMSGLSPVPTVEIWSPTGAKVVDAENSTALAGGFYYYDYSPNPVLAGVYVAKATTANSSADIKQVPAISFDPLALNALSNYASDTAGYALFRVGATSTIQLFMPVVHDQTTLNIIRGDEYYYADSRALEWEDEDGTLWPDLTDATITFSARNRSPRSTRNISVAGTVVTPSGAGKLVRVELSSAQTLVLDASGLGYDYDVQAVLSNTHVVTLTLGEMRVYNDITVG